MVELTLMDGAVEFTLRVELTLRGLSLSIGDVVLVEVVRA